MNLGVKPNLPTILVVYRKLEQSKFECTKVMFLLVLFIFVNFIPLRSCYYLFVRGEGGVGTGFTLSTCLSVFCLFACGAGGFCLFVVAFSPYYIFRTAVIICS